MKRESALKCGHVSEVDAEWLVWIATPFFKDKYTLDAWCKRCKKWVRVMVPEYERMELF